MKSGSKKLLVSSVRSFLFLLTWDCFDRSRGVSILVHNSTILLEIEQSGYQFNRLSKMNISEIGLQKAVGKLCPKLSFFVDMGLL